MNLLKKIDKHLEEYLLVGLLSSTVLLIAVQVFMRYVLESSLSWTEELARFMFVWMVYLGISYGVKQDRHIRVDAALLFMPEKLKILTRIVADVLFIVFCILIIKQGIGVALNLLQFGQTSPALSIPMAYVYLASPVGLSLAVVRLIQSMVGNVRNLFETQPKSKAQEVNAH